jgi:3-oxoacyl-[acyl-carrier protein] reductase
MYALITGGTGGIGEAVARQLAAEGYKVGIHSFSSEGKAKSLAAELGGDYYIADLSQPEESLRLAKEVLERHEKADLIVTCHGRSNVGLVTDFSPEETERIFEINVLSVMHIVKVLLPAMIRRQRGKIVTVSSMWGECGASCEVDYSATKGALIAYTKALAKEVAPSGINVNSVSPGAVDTKMLSCFSEEERAVLTEEIPAGRLARPEDIAAAVSFLVSDRAAYINGEVLKVNGAYLT